MTVFLDTSALVKLLVVERETAALRAYLAARPASPRAASALARTELRRAARRIDPDLLPAADRVLTGLALVRIDDKLLDDAGTLGPALLRTLDALHLAAALRVQPVEAVLTYDERMQDAGRQLGLPITAPGM